MKISQNVLLNYDLVLVSSGMKTGLFPDLLIFYFSKAFPKSLLTDYISILFLCRTNNSTTTRLMVSFWPTAVLSSKALTGHDLEDTPVKHSMLSVVVKAKSLSWTSNVRHLFIIRSNFLWKEKSLFDLTKKPSIFARAGSRITRDFSRQITQFGTAFYDWTRKIANICAAGSQLRSGSWLASEVDLRTRLLVKSHQGHGLEDKPVKPLSMLVFSGQM